MERSLVMPRGISHAPAEVPRNDPYKHMEPEGVGLYLRSLSKSLHHSPKRAADRAADHGISFVAIMACWQELRKGKLFHSASNIRHDALVRYAEAFAAKGIDVWIWGYPWAGAEDRFVGTMRNATELCGGTLTGWLYDPELGYKWKGRTPRGARGTNMRSIQPEAIRTVSASGTRAIRTQQAERLMSLTLDALNEGTGIGVTSYGVAKYHPNFPWEVFTQYGWLSPQLYTVTPQLVDAGIAQWRQHFVEATGSPGTTAHIVPSIGTYGPKSGAELHEHLSSFVDGEEDIKGFIAWSWRQTNSYEWRILARWADWLERGVGMLPE